MWGSSDFGMRMPSELQGASIISLSLPDVLEYSITRNAGFVSVPVLMMAFSKVWQSIFDIGAFEPRMHVRPARKLQDLCSAMFMAASRLLLVLHVSEKTHDTFSVVLQPAQGNFDYTCKLDVDAAVLIRGKAVHDLST